MSVLPTNYTRGPIVMIDPPQAKLSLSTPLDSDPRSHLVLLYCLFFQISWADHDTPSSMSPLHFPRVSGCVLSAGQLRDHSVQHVRTQPYRELLVVAPPNATGSLLVGVLACFSTAEFWFGFQLTARHRELRAHPSDQAPAQRSPGPGRGPVRRSR